MKQIFGDFRENLPQQHEFLIIGFSPSLLPIQQRWRNNVLSADFVANYITTFFPISNDNPDSVRRQTEVKSAVNYIANELLENGMKFNDRSASYAIKFELHLIEELENTSVILLISNSISEENQNNLQTFIDKFLNSDTHDLYINQLTKSAEDKNSKASGLGLLTMKNDYAAKLGWKFETIQKQPEVVIVTTMVQFAV
ncbi:MAG: DUF6272 family protein [Nostoc sp.]|uniref:DUF6272 family protein n=1 Tax=Nostoc sp. TaxID=1180 RepID=UPI002FF8010F